MTDILDSSIAISVFLRNGDEGRFTKTIENHDDKKKAEITEICKAFDSEKPILAYFVDIREYCILTDKSLLWSEHGVRKRKALQELEKVTIDREMAIFRNVDSAFDIRHLKLTDKSGGDFSINVEPGEPLSGLWNVLKFAIG